MSVRSVFKKILIVVGVVLLLWVIWVVYNSYTREYGYDDPGICTAWEGWQSDGMGGCEDVRSEPEPEPEPILTAFSTTWKTLHTDTLTYQFPTYEESPYWSFDFWPPVVTEIPRRIGECPPKVSERLQASYPSQDLPSLHIRSTRRFHDDGTEYCVTIVSKTDADFSESQETITLHGESEYGVYAQIEGPTMRYILSCGIQDDPQACHKSVDANIKEMGRLLVDILRSVRRIE